MNSIKNFFEAKHIADKKWQANGNFITIKLIRILVILLLLSAPITIYLTVVSSASTYLTWLFATFLIFAMLYIIHKRFEKLVDIRQANEKLSEAPTSPINPN